MANETEKFSWKRIPYSSVVGCGFMDMKTQYVAVIIPPTKDPQEAEAIADMIEHSAALKQRVDEAVKEIRERVVEITSFTGYRDIRVSANGILDALRKLEGK